MVHHVTAGCTDLARATLFYDAVLAKLGLRQRPPYTPDYDAPDYDGADLRDPDGNKLHVVNRVA